ncbi:MAG: hypothetical protein KIT24_11550 [Phycisphaeraceae bacterium]|nr:hypothetical protein [Phycisphaeraceae bacterium]
MLEAVTPEDMEAIILRLVALAKEGDIGAIREVLLRTLGRPVEVDILERLDALEAGIARASGEDEP